VFSDTSSLYFADFGVAGTLGGLPVRVIFDAPAEHALGAVIAPYPQVLIEDASVPAAAEGLPLSIPQGNYTVREVLPDGTGITTLLLSAAA
jgi:hypothetical protein